MAGSTQATLEQLFVDMILYSDSVSATSQPTNTLVTTFINQAILQIAAQIKPQELLDSTGTAANISANSNTVAIPSTYLKLTKVFYKNASGKYTEVYPKNFASAVNSRTPSSFFDTNKTGTPSSYVIQGGTLIFDTHFDRTETGAILLWGILKPTTLSTASPSVQTELDIDFDMLIIYKAAMMYYLREEDFDSVASYKVLADQEEARLRLSSSEFSSFGTVEMDPTVFRGASGNFSDPGVFFQ